MIAMLGLAVWIAGAWAAPRVAASLEEGTFLSELTSTADGRWVAMLEEGSDEIRLLDTWSWETSAFTACATHRGVSMEEQGDAVRLWAGCEDGTVVALALDELGTLTAETPITVTDASLHGIVVTGQGLVVVTEHESGGNPVVHHVDLDSGEVDGPAGYPSTLGHGSFVDLVALVSGGMDYAIVSHGGDDLSKIDAGGGGSSSATTGITVASGMDLMTTEDGSVFLAGGPGGVLRFNLGDNSLSLVIDDEDGIQEADALSLSPGGDGMWVADLMAGAFVRYAYNSSTGYPGSEPELSVAMPTPDSGTLAPVSDMITVGDQVLATTEGGQLWVLTELPWVEIDALSTDVAGQGDLVSFAFTSDLAGSWSVRLGSTDDTDGSTLFSGEVEAGERVELELEVDDSFAEGSNALRVVVDGEAGAGHDVVYLSVDNPPGAITLTADDLSFGDGRIFVDIHALDDVDLSHFLVFVTVSPWSADDWQSCAGPGDTGDTGDTGAGGEGSAIPCGPPFDGADDLEFPLEILAWPGEAQTVEISPLTNDTTYHVGVRAVDLGGMEGPMSDVVTEVPRETYGAAELAQDEGGLAWCGTGAPMSGLAVLLGLFAVGLRRAGPAMGLLLLGAGLGVPAAHAGEDRQRVHGDLQVWAAKVEHSDANLGAVFGAEGTQFGIEWGPSWGRTVELDLGLGALVRSGSLVAADGEASGEVDALVAIPLSVGLTARLDVLPNQPVVPYVRAGIDSWFWRESWDESGQASSVQGLKRGHHQAVGLQLLLDIFDPARAARLDAVEGYVDSYLFVERRTQVMDVEGLSFGGELWLVGLKLSS